MAAQIIGEEWFSAIVHSALDCVIAMDKKGRIVDFNPASEATFGYRRADVVGKKLADLIIPERFRASHHEGMKRYLSTGIPKVAGRRVEVVGMRSDGAEFPVELTIIPIHPGESVFFTAYLRDISERKRLELARLEHEAELKAALEQTVLSVSRTLETRDPYTAGHQRRVAQLARAIGHDLGWEKHRCDGLYLGCMIHDIGKIAVPAEILTRPGRLDEAAMALVRTHCMVGYQITQDIRFPWPVADIIHQHHERLDGSGYPQGLKGDAIVYEARIAAVADVFEAIQSHRPYRLALGPKVAQQEIEKNRGILYDADVVDSCLRLIRSGEFVFDAAT